MLFANTRRATNVSLTIAMLLILALATACGGGALGGNSGNNGNGGNGNSTPPPPPPPPASSVTLTPTSSTIYAGQTVTFKATVNGTTDQTLTWSVNGVVGGNATIGTISIYGLYQSPNVRPASSPVTIRAVSTTNSSAAATASVAINNAIPKIVAITPDTFQSPASFSLTIYGTGFVNGATVNWDSTVLPTTFVSTTQLTATGNQPTKVKTVGVSVNNPNPGGTKSNIFYMMTDPSTTMSKAVASRMLQQMSFGPSFDTITQMQASGLQEFMNYQFTIAQSGCFLAPTKDDNIGTIEQRFLICAVSRNDQLRQRVAFALSQIMVASSNKVNDTTAMTMWQNMFQKDAFGNYYDLLKDVTLSPVMGNYLDMVNNDKPNPATGTSANENYAREVLQLFSIGLEQLNSDGTVQTDSSGNPIPTYSLDTVTNFARVFTGWTYPGSSSFGGSARYTGPMIPFDNHHDTGSKTLLNGFVVPAGGTAQADLDLGLQNIFNHPNVGPFICKQLIQHLVTSNPSPEYVGRVVAVFNNNGSNVRGDLRAVVAAILMDAEARRGDDPSQVQPNDGHLKEPILLITNLYRAMNVATDETGTISYAVNMKQEPLNSPSVFNFYHPGFEIPNSNLLGPEFELFNSSTTITRVNFINDAVYGQIGQAYTPDFSYYLTLAPNPDLLVDRLGDVMMNGQMSAQMRSEILTAVSGISDNTNRVKAAIYLIASSSQYQVQR